MKKRREFIGVLEIQPRLRRHRDDYRLSREPVEHRPAHAIGAYVERCGIATRRRPAQCDKV